MKQTNIQTRRDQKSCTIRRKEFMILFQTKVTISTDFSVVYGTNRVRYIFWSSDIGEIKFTIPRWGKKSCGERAAPFRQQVAYVSRMNDSWMNNVVDIE